MQPHTNTAVRWPRKHASIALYHMAGRCEIRLWVGGMVVQSTAVNRSPDMKHFNLYMELRSDENFLGKIVKMAQVKKN